MYMPSFLLVGEDQLYSVLFDFLLLVTEHRALNILVKHSTAKLQAHPRVTNFKYPKELYKVSRSRRSLTYVSNS